MVPEGVVVFDLRTEPGPRDVSLVLGWATVAAVACTPAVSTPEADRLPELTDGLIEARRLIKGTRVTGTSHVLHAHQG